MRQSISGEFSRKRRPEQSAGGSPTVSEDERDGLRFNAARLRFSRQLRRKLFGSAMVAESAWDILLTLYLAEGRGVGASVPELSRSTYSPISTTLRWLAYLEESGLASRAKGEPRKEGVELTAKGRCLLDAYFIELRDVDDSAGLEESPEVVPVQEPSFKR